MPEITIETLVYVEEGTRVGGVTVEKNLIHHLFQLSKFKLVRKTKFHAYMGNNNHTAVSIREQDVFVFKEVQ